MPDPNQNNDNQNPINPTVTDVSSGDQPVITPSSDSTVPSVIPPPVTPPADPIVTPVNIPSMPPETQTTDTTNQLSEVPSFLHSTDLPPLAPDFQNVSGGADPVKKTEDKNVSDANSGTNAPFPDLPITTGSPKKKFGGGKIIATILGIFLLVGGIAGGVILTQQSQNLSEKAEGNFDYTPPGKYTCGSGSGEGCEGKSNGDSCGGERVCKIRENGKDCSCVGPEPTVTPTSSPSTPYASCQNIKAYSSTWTLLTDAQLSTLTPSTVVNFCVLGTASEGTFDRAKFTINTVAQAETTTKRPATDDFCQSYAIPAGVTSFNITAQIHHVTLGWK